MLRPIAISLAPNMEDDDLVLALGIFAKPWKWFNKRPVEELERQFATLFGKEFKAISVNSGRSAQYLILKALGIGEGDEIAIQAFTCVAVPNSVLWTGANPLYVDVDESLNIDSHDLQKKVSKKTKAVIVQHTLGVPARMDAVKKIANQKDLVIMEDCAHSLGATYNGNKVGTLGDVAFFSFGRDKVISSVFGGMVLCKDENIYKKLLELRVNLQRPSVGWTAQQLLHPILMSAILPIYNIGLGKLLLFVFQKIGFLSKAVYEEEKKGGQSGHFPKKMPGALAELALHQLKKLNRFNVNRKRISEYYFENLKDVGLNMPARVPGAVWLRFPIFTKSASNLFAFLKKRKVLPGDWYRKPVVPVFNLSDVGYRKGSCPNAERLGRQIINLPTYPTLSQTDASHVVQLIKSWRD